MSADCLIFTQRACPHLILSVVDIRCTLFALSDIHFKFAEEYIYRYTYIFLYLFIFIFNVNDRGILVVFNEMIIYIIPFCVLFAAVFHYFKNILQ